MSPYGRCTTDGTGLIVTILSGRWAYPSWVGLPLLINGVLSTVAGVQAANQLTLGTPVGTFSSPVPYGPTRETVYQAFFNYIKLATGIVTASRVPQIFSNVDASQKPFLFVEQVGENPKREGYGIPYNWELDLAIGICVYSPNPETIAPVTLLNPILDALENALTPSPPNGAQTLDGIVYEARLINNGKEAAGAIGPEAFAYVPARIYTT